MQRAIRAGEIFRGPFPPLLAALPWSPLAAYDVLKKSNPSPHMFFMQDNDFTLFAPRRKAFAEVRCRQPSD